MVGNIFFPVSCVFLVSTVHLSLAQTQSEFFPGQQQAKSWGYPSSEIFENTGNRQAFRPTPAVLIEGNIPPATRPLGPVRHAGRPPFSMATSTTVPTPSSWQNRRQQIQKAKETSHFEYEVVPKLSKPPTQPTIVRAGPPRFPPQQILTQLPASVSPTTRQQVQDDATVTPSPKPESRTDRSPPPFVVTNQPPVGPPTYATPSDADFQEGFRILNDLFMEDAAADIRSNLVGGTDVSFSGFPPISSSNTSSSDAGKSAEPEPAIQLTPAKEEGIIIAGSPPQTEHETSSSEEEKTSLGDYNAQATEVAYGPPQYQPAPPQSHTSFMFSDPNESSGGYNLYSDDYDLGSLPPFNTIGNSILPPAPLPAPRQPQPPQQLRTAPPKNPTVQQQKPPQNSSPQTGYNVPSQGGFSTLLQEGYITTSQASTKTASKGGYNAPLIEKSKVLPQGGGYNGFSQGGYNLPVQGKSNTPPQGGGYNVPSQGGHSLPAQGQSKVPQGGGYNVPSPGGYNLPAQGQSKAPPQGGGYNLPSQGGHSLPAQGKSKTLPQGGGYNMPSQGKAKTPPQGGGYSSPVQGKSKAPLQGVGYDAPSQGGYSLLSGNGPVIPMPMMMMPLPAEDMQKQSPPSSEEIQQALAVLTRYASKQAENLGMSMSPQMVMQMMQSDPSSNQYGAPPSPPSHQYGAPPQQPASPPSNHYGAPPQQQAPPPSNQYGAPSQQQPSTTPSNASVDPPQQQAPPQNTAYNAPDQKLDHTTPVPNIPSLDLTAPPLPSAFNNYLDGYGGATEPAISFTSAYPDESSPHPVYGPPDKPSPVYGPPDNPNPVYGPPDKPVYGPPTGGYAGSVSGGYEGGASGGYGEYGSGKGWSSDSKEENKKTNLIEAKFNVLRSLGGVVVGGIRQAGALNRGILNAGLNVVSGLGHAKGNLAQALKIPIMSMMPKPKDPEPKPKPVYGPPKPEYGAPTPENGVSVITSAEGYGYGPPTPDNGASGGYGTPQGGWSSTEEPEKEKEPSTPGPIASLVNAAQVVVGGIANTALATGKAAVGIGISKNDFIKNHFVIKGDVFTDMVAKKIANKNEYFENVLKHVASIFESAGKPPDGGWSAP